MPAPFSSQAFAEEWTAKITAALTRTDVKAEITEDARKWAMLKLVANLEIEVALIVDRQKANPKPTAAVPPPPVPKPVVTEGAEDLPRLPPGEVQTLNPGDVGSISDVL